MKIVVFGGAGAMGAKAVETLASMPEFTEIVVADLDVDQAKAVADAAGEHVRADRVDALSADLSVILDGAWGVLSTLGPFTRFGKIILTAAITAGCHFVDIMDDWEPTLEAFELDSAAREAGVTALIGMGASPGVSNLLAARAVTYLDEVTEIVTGWPIQTIAPISITPDRPNAATVHFVIQASGSIRVTRDGKLQDVTPREVIDLEYPGYGLVSARSLGHPEAVTLRRTYTTLQSSLNVMTGHPWFFDRVDSIMERVDNRALTHIAAAAEIEATLDESRTALADPRDPHGPGLWTWAKGIKDGQLHAVGAQLTRFPRGGMAGSTSIPAAIGLQLIARGAVTDRGVVTAEAAIDADTFFSEFDAYCNAPDPLTPLVQITNARIV